MMMTILDRYLLREWLKIFTATVVGFPLIPVLFEITDKLAEYLQRELEPTTIALAYVYSLPEKIYLILPAAVLFATVFSLVSMNRHSELTAAKASGRSFHRLAIPVFVAALFVSAAGLGLGELAPSATRRQLELLGELEIRAQNTRQNFVYRAEAGWVYTIRSLNVRQRQMTDLVLEREGSGADYPTLAVQARLGRYNDTTATWTLRDGRYRTITEDIGESTVLSEETGTNDLRRTRSLRRCARAIRWRWPQATGVPGSEDRGACHLYRHRPVRCAARGHSTPRERCFRRRRKPCDDNAVLAPSPVVPGGWRRWRSTPHSCSLDTECTVRGRCSSVAEEGADVATGFG